MATMQDAVETVETKETVDTKKPKKEKVRVAIKPPNFSFAEFWIHGIDGPLVIHRFSAKTKQEMKLKAETGKPASSRKIREPKDMEEVFNQARYRSKEGWDGFHAASIRNGLIECCRLVDYKMTLAKMSLFVRADGYDALEPQIPLIRIYGPEPIQQVDEVALEFPCQQEDMARVSTGDPYVTVRPAYHNWRAKIQLRWDADQFTLPDVTNLLARMGVQNGIGEGRPNSKKSAGMGWGCFELEGKE